MDKWLDPIFVTEWFKTIEYNKLHPLDQYSRRSEAALAFANAIALAKPEIISKYDIRQTAYIISGEFNVAHKT